MTEIALDPNTGGLSLRLGDAEITLHPLWLRERTGQTDPLTHQRLYEHAELPADLRVTAISHDPLRLRFSDGEDLALDLPETLRELGWQSRPDALPTPTSWRADLTIPDTSWGDLNDPQALKAFLVDYFINGFAILQDTPTDRGALLRLSRRFGYLRETNFGDLFNVETKPDPSDLAYTDVALASHTDNPYRDPVPGIQFLHCLRNEVAGGLSTLVDGMAIAEALREEDPVGADILEQVSVRFRYTGPSAILEHHGPLIERDPSGIVRHVRLSSRLDFVPALDPDTLTTFYDARRRLHDMSNSDDFQIRFPFRPGTLLMMDNYRLLHGRTAFDGKQGHRHLQGGYIDHDGPASLYRLLVAGHQITSIPRETS